MVNFKLMYFSFNSVIRDMLHTFNELNDLKEKTHLIELGKNIFFIMSSNINLKHTIQVRYQRSNITANPTDIILCQQVNTYS